MCASNRYFGATSSSRAYPKRRKLFSLYRSSVYISRTENWAVFFVTEDYGRFVCRGSAALVQQFTSLPARGTPCLRPNAVTFHERSSTSLLTSTLNRTTGASFSTSPAKASAFIRCLPLSAPAH